MLRSNRERNTTKANPMNAPQNRPIAEFTGTLGLAGKNGGFAGSTTVTLVARIAAARLACCTFVSKVLVQHAVRIHFALQHVVVDGFVGLVRHRPLGLFVVLLQHLFAPAGRRVFIAHALHERCRALFRSLPCTGRSAPAPAELSDVPGSTWPATGSSAAANPSACLEFAQRRIVQRLRQGFCRAALRFFEL